MYNSANGSVIPNVKIGSIQEGAPFRPNYYPGGCSLYVDVRTPPELRAIQVQRELKEVLSKIGVEYDLEMYASRIGYEAKGIGPVVKVIDDTYQNLYGERPPPANTFRAIIRTDTNIYNEMGIPACKFGPGVRNGLFARNRSRLKRSSVGRRYMLWHHLRFVIGRYSAVLVP